MKKLRLINTLLINSFVICLLNAQTSKVDSLENILNQHKKKDTAKVNLLNKTALQLLYIDNEKLLKFSEEAEKLADELNYTKGKADGLWIKGVYYYNTSDFHEARDNFFKSLKLYEADSDTNGIATCLNKIGLTYWKTGDYTQALENFQESYQLAEQLDNKNLIFKCLNSFGILSFQQGNYHKAIEYFEKSLEIAELIGDNKGTTDCLNNIGFIYMNQGNNDLALDYFQRTLVKLEESGLRQEIPGCYLNIGIIHQNQGKYMQAVDYYQKALDIYKEFGKRQEVSMCLNNIGLIYQTQGNLPLALEYIQNSLAIKEEIGEKRGASSCKLNIGIINMEQGKYDVALDYFQESLQTFEDLGDKRGISNCLLAIGNTHGQRGDYFLSLSNLRNSLEIKEELSDKYGICQLNLDMGEVYFKIKEYNKALSSALISLKIGNEQKFLSLLTNIHLLLSEIYAATKNYENAYQNFVTYKQLNDSIFNEKNIKKITGLEYQYEYEKEKQAMELKQQKKDAIQTEKFKRQATIRNSFIGGFALMLILALVVLRSFLQKLKANRILAEQKIIIEETNNKLNQTNEELESTLEYLKMTQAELIQSEKMASLGQLIAGIAHEINNSIGAIKASAGTIIYCIQQNMVHWPNLLKTFSVEEISLLLDMVNRSVQNNFQISTKEERVHRKRLTAELKDKNMENADIYADMLVDMGIYDKIEPYLPVINNQSLPVAINMSQQMKNSQNIKIAVDRVAKIVFALKSYARNGNSQKMVKANVADTIETVLSIYHNQLKQGINIIKDFQQVPEIFCYPDELNQVWTNLIHNAVQAMNGKGEIRLAISNEQLTIENQTHQNIIVSISDNGCGIPPEKTGKIFEAFYTTKPMGEGSGLGLYIVKQIIDKHNGKIWIESEIERGTTFFIRLPIKSY